MKIKYIIVDLDLGWYDNDSTCRGNDDLQGPQERYRF